MTAGPRLVSLCPSITETLFAIGAGPGVVGATRYCVRPREPLRKVERVGGTKNPDLARIVALAPDVVFVNAEENRREDAEALQRELRVHVSMPRTVAEVPAVVREWGREAARREEAGGLAAEIERAATEFPPPGEPLFRYSYFIWKDPWMTVSGDTYVSDLFRYAGGENVFAESADRYPAVSVDDVLTRRPDVLFFPTEPYHFTLRHLPVIREAFGESPRVEFVDGDDCCWHGARTRQGLALMRKLRESF